MDIDLLAKMVKEAILDHDAVTLPGVGSFVAELMPSTFSDKGYTINPPYRRMYFSPKQGNDTCLADLYARDNAEVDTAMATRILTEFLAEMKEILKVKKTVIFPGLGRLRATRENHFFFVADEDLDIYPEGLGLAPLSLKTHVETPEEVATAVAGLAELISEPEPAPVVEPEPMPTVEPETEEKIPGQAGNDEKGAGNDEKVVEPVAVPEPEPEPTPVVEPEPVPMAETQTVEEIPDQVGNDEEEPVSEEISPRAALGRNDKSRKWLKILLIVLGVLVVLLLLVVLLSRIAPGLLDPLLYSKEELQILRYQ
jgi:hypothetical protein